MDVVDVVGAAGVVVEMEIEAGAELDVDVRHCCLLFVDWCLLISAC